MWRDRVEMWRKSPSAFVREALGAMPEEWQDTEVLKPLENGQRFIAIRAGHGVGKTTVEAWVILWFLLFHRPCKIPVTANSQDQLRDVVWAEISKWKRKLPPFLADMIDVSAEKVAIKADPDGAFAVARTARPERPEALQGFHSEHLLFVIEEASGIPDIIFETAGGALTGKHCYVIMAGNPTRASGYFYDAFHRNATSWHCAHVPCSRSKKVDPEYIDKIVREFGRDSNTYRVRVEGEFPTHDDVTVIPLDKVLAAKGRDLVTTNSYTVMGADVARFGNDTSTIVVRQGNTLRTEYLREYRNLSLTQFANAIERLYLDMPAHDRPREIVVDSIGYGAGVAEILRQPGRATQGIVTECAVSESPMRDTGAFRLRDELWFAGRTWFVEAKCKLDVIAHDPQAMALLQKMIAELTTPMYAITTLGKYKVESKDELKKRGVPSPNLADAFLMTFAAREWSKLDPHRSSRDRGPQTSWMAA